MLSRLFIAALWSTGVKELTTWLSFVMFHCVFVAFPCGILGQVWYLIISIPDLNYQSYFKKKTWKIETVTVIYQKIGVFFFGFCFASVNITVLGLTNSEY